MRLAGLGCMHHAFATHGQAHNPCNLATLTLSMAFVIALSCAGNGRVDLDRSDEKKRAFVSMWMSVLA